MPCPTCGGVGHLSPATDSGPRDWGRACPSCDGTGKVQLVTVQAVVAEARRQIEERTDG